jgi:hypothetical protein
MSGWVPLDEPLDLLDWLKRGGLPGAILALVGGYLAWPEPAHAPAGSSPAVAVSYIGEYQSHFYSKMTVTGGVFYAIGVAALGAAIGFVVLVALVKVTGKSPSDFGAEG